MTGEPVQETPNPAVRGGFSAIPSTERLHLRKWVMFKQGPDIYEKKITRCVMQSWKKEDLILIW